MDLISKLDVLNTIENNGLVPIFYHPDIEVCQSVVSACYRGGSRVFEFTNRGDDAHVVFEKLGRWVNKEMSDLVLGAGSIVDGATTALYIQLGARFIVSPLMTAEMASVCNRRKVPWIPGCSTVTEISNAESLGADIVKLFPAIQAGGPDFIRNVLGPCPWFNIMPAGGVTTDEENLKTWFEAGAFCVGMGSKLFVKSPSGAYNYSEIETKTREVLAIIRKIKGEK